MSDAVYDRQDPLLEALAAFATEAPIQLDGAATTQMESIVMDALAVALGALRHPAVAVALRYSHNNAADYGATLWGTRLKATVETATLVNGVPLRGYDYNDFYMSKSGGHPSDMIPGLLALAETRKISGAKFLGSLALGYEATLNVLDAIDVDSKRWDYPNLLVIGATVVAARMLGLSKAQAAEALAIAVISHFATDEVESGDLNARGDLTMWKRFNGSHGIRQAVYAVLLAEAGAEGAVRPFAGASGFLSKVDTTSDLMAQLLERLSGRAPLRRFNETRFKRWPVGSRGQSAIQAALQARAGVADVWKVRSIKVLCDTEVYDHLLGRRSDPWHPISRETADHALPYIVATAVLDGGVHVDSFDVEVVTNAARQAYMNEKVVVTAVPELSKGAIGGFLASVEIVDEYGNTHLGVAKSPPGHVDNPFVADDFEAKFRENVMPVFGAAQTEALMVAIRSLGDMSDVTPLTTLLAHDLY